MSIILSVTIALLVCTVLVWVLRPLAMRIGLVDSPGERKQHVGHVPLVGGIAMFCGFMFAVLVLEQSLAGYRALFVGTALLVIVGILDDFHDLPPWVRFVAQIVAALIMTLWGGVVVRDLGALFGFGSIPLGVWGVPVTVFVA